MNRTRKLLLALACSLILSVAWGQDGEPSVKVQKVADGIYMLIGNGGNIGVSVGEGTAFIIDDQYAPVTPAIQAAVADLSEHPIGFVFNTHWHGDHTGGNENLGKAGALIVAHDNVRVRMSSRHFNRFFNRETPPSPPDALPVVTFDNTVSLHLNGEDIHGFHVPPAHTDGDSVIHFRNSNVFHMGDTFFNSSYPFIDLSSGGSSKGMIEAADMVLAIADDQSKIMPGHGPLSDKQGLQAYRDMLATLVDRIENLIGDGASLEDVIAANPTADYDAQWGGSSFMPADRWLGIIYTDLAGTD